MQRAQKLSKVFNYVKHYFTSLNKNQTHLDLCYRLDIIRF